MTVCSDGKNAELIPLNMVGYACGVDPSALVGMTMVTLGDCHGGGARQSGVRRASQPLVIEHRVDF